MKAQQHELAASAVERKRREIEQRLKEFHEAPMYAKALPGRLLAAAIFELFDHQAAFNQGTLARLARLEAHFATATFDQGAHRG